MAQNTRSDERPTSTWRTHGSDEDGVYNFFEWFLLVFVLIPSSLVEVLPQQLYGRLGSVLLLGRHVKVVDKQDAMLLRLRTVLSLTNLVQLAVDDILSLHGRSLGGESKLDRHILLGWQLIEDVVLDVDGLSSSSGAAK